MWFPVAAVPTLFTTVLIAYAAHKFFTSAAARESSPQKMKVHWSEDLEKVSTPGSRRSESTWNKIARIFLRSKDDSPNHRFPTPSTIFGDGPSINDPSRLVRRSTDRSLTERHYIPPRSTVQFLPGAYDLSNIDGPYSYPSVSTYVPPGTQAYDFATSSGMYNQYVSKTDYNQYSYQSPPFEVSYNQAIPFARQELDGVAQQAYPRSELASVGYEPELPPSPPGPQISSAYDRSYKNNLNKNSAEQAENLEIRQARAIFSFTGSDPEDLRFEQGDTIVVLSEVDKSVDWW
jgi:SH3 domain